MIQKINIMYCFFNKSYHLSCFVTFLISYWDVGQVFWQKRWKWRLSESHNRPFYFWYLKRLSGVHVIRSAKDCKKDSKVAQRLNHGKHLTAISKKIYKKLVWFLLKKIWVFGKGRSVKRANKLNFNIGLIKN